MNGEYEVRVLEIDTESLIEKLDKYKANKIGTFEQKRYVYNLVPFKHDNER